MATYTVTPNQNIWDVSIALYGTIEGVFDLLISNSWLTLTTDLKAGMALEYHDYFVLKPDIVNELHTQKLTPANGERSVYYKPTSAPLCCMVGIPEDRNRVSFAISGDGDMWVDWGDNTPLEHLLLQTEEKTIEHFFNSAVDSRVIKMYGDFNIRTWNISDIGGALLPMVPIVVEEVTSKSNGNLLDGLFLFDETTKVNLQGMKISSLSPIGDMSLQELDLRNVDFSSIEVLDDYLEYIVENYGNRRNCIVRLTTEPSEAGMAAINTILNEPSWNASGAWQFIINADTYTIEQ